jgi:hypothetical protein
VGRANRIVTDALRLVAAGADLDEAFALAVAMTACAPASVALARSIYIAIVTKPENA